MGTLELPEEKEPWREVESVSLYMLGAVTGYEKTVIGNPKVSFFVFVFVLFCFWGCLFVWGLFGWLVGFFFFLFVFLFLTIFFN